MCAQVQGVCLQHQLFRGLCCVFLPWQSALASMAAVGVEVYGLHALLLAKEPTFNTVVSGTLVSTAQRPGEALHWGLGAPRGP